MKDSTILALAGIGALTAIELVCLLQGIDNVVLASVTAIIAGLAGYSIRARREPE